MTDEDTSRAVPAESPVAAVEMAAASAPTPVEPQETTETTPTAQIPASEPLVPSPTPTAAAPVQNFARNLLVKARATIQFQKTAKLEKIMTELQKKNHITNDEVEKLLHVSDATATRYLEALVKQGKIKKIGTTGKAVEYRNL